MERINHMGGFFGTSLTAQDYACIDAFDGISINESARAVTGTEYKNNIVAFVRNGWGEERSSSIENNIDGTYKRFTVLYRCRG